MVDRSAIAGAGAAAAGPDRSAAALPADGASGRGDPCLGASGGSTAGSGLRSETPTFSRRSRTRSRTTKPLPVKSPSQRRQRLSEHCGRRRHRGDPPGSGRRARPRRPEHDDEIDDVASDAESPEPESEPVAVGPDRLAQVREQAARIGRYLWQRLVYLTAVLWPGWSAKRGSGRPRQPDGCGRG